MTIKKTANFSRKIISTNDIFDHINDISFEIETDNKAIGKVVIKNSLQAEISIGQRKLIIKPRTKWKIGLLNRFEIFDDGNNLIGFIKNSGWTLGENLLQWTNTSIDDTWKFEF